MKKNTGLLSVVFYGLCAVIWTIRAAVGVYYGEYDYSVLLFVLNILCSVIWIAAFVMQIVRYKKSNKDE